mgnify:CR=1 FL=1
MFRESWRQPVDIGDKYHSLMKHKSNDAVLKEKKQILLFAGQEYAKVRSEKGLHPIPAKIPIFFYVNKKQGTYTIAEYHPTYKSFCVIAYGENFQDFSNGIQ